VDRCSISAIWIQRMRFRNVVLVLLIVGVVEGSLHFYLPLTLNSLLVIAGVRQGSIAMSHQQRGLEIRKESKERQNISGRC